MRTGSNKTETSRKHLSQDYIDVSGEMKQMQQQDAAAADAESVSLPVDGLDGLVGRLFVDRLHREVLLPERLKGVLGQLGHVLRVRNRVRRARSASAKAADNGKTEAGGTNLPTRRVPDRVDRVWNWQQQHKGGGIRAGNKQTSVDSQKLPETW